MMRPTGSSPSFSCPRIAVRRTASLRSAYVAGIHAFLGSMSKAWMAGTSPAMTEERTKLKSSRAKSSGMPLPRHCEERSDEQSSAQCDGPGLLRGACHRAGHFGPDPLARNDVVRLTLQSFARSRVAALRWRSGSRKSVQQNGV